MDRILGKYSDVLFAVLRVVVGLNFAVHGAQKLFGAFGGHAQPLISLFGLAGIIEFAGGLMVAFGLLASWAAFVASGEMATAYFMSHFPHGFLPQVNRGELAVLYCFVFLFIAAHGPGRFSLDAARRR